MKITSEAKLLLAMGAIVLAGGGFLLFSNRAPGGPGSSEPPMPIPTPRPVSYDEFQSVLKKTPHIKGDPSLRYTIIEFADFQCRTCRRAFSSITKDFAGKIPVRLAFRHFPIKELHAYAIPAAIASEAASQQGKFWEAYDALFKDENPAWSTDYIRNTMERIGLDMARYDQYMSDPSSEGVVLTGQEQARELGISSTPTFWVLDTQTKTVKVAIGTAIYDALKGVPNVPSPPPSPKPGPR